MTVTDDTAAGETALAMGEADPAAHRATFERVGRVQIPNFLSETSARRALRAAQQETPWHVACHDGERGINYVARDFAALPAEERAAIQNKVVAAGRKRFSYFYLNYRLGVPAFREAYPDAYLNTFFNFLNSDAVLNFVKSVTGIDEIRGASAQATCYQAGHFLAQHNDLDDNLGKLVAFVVGLSPDWRADWGGLTLFFDEKGGPVTEGLLPQFGGLTLFKVPQDHCVSMVTPLAGGSRYSIVGWFIDQGPERYQA